MPKLSGRLLLAFILWTLTTTVHAQITGAIIDAETGDSIPFASASYKGHNLAVSSNVFGVYSIQRKEGWELTFSAVGYKSQTIHVNSKTKSKVDIKLKTDNKTLEAVVVKSKKGKYSRKDNPAVELMRRVIEAKK